MINLMAEGTEAKFLDAWRVYQDGAFSRTYAVLTLEKPLAHKVKIGTNITGRSSDGSFLDCAAMATTEAGEKKLKVRYRGSESLDPTTRCVVRANPNPITSGCKLSLLYIVAYFISEWCESNVCFFHQACLIMELSKYWARSSSLLDMCTTN
jgi:hypothetical protein